MSERRKPDAWMPLYIGDYLRDTSRLTRDQHGGYLLLIFDYWVNGPLPDDDEQLAAVTKSTRAEWRKLRPVLERFFQISHGAWHHKRIDQELANTTRLNEQRRNAGAASAEARRKRALNEKSTSVATELFTDEKRNGTPSPSPSPSPSPEEEKTHTPPAARMRATLSVSDLEEFQSWYEFYPRKEDRGHAEAAFLKARKIASLEELTEGVRRYAKGISAAATERRYIKLPATWLTGKCWLDESGANGAQRVPGFRSPRSPAPVIPDEQTRPDEIQ